MQDGSGQRRLRADARRNAERIVRVAIDGLERSGQPLRLDELAERAGTGTATLYRLFGSRDGLVEAAFATFFAEQVEPLTTPRGGTPVADLVAVLHDTVAELAANRALLRAAQDAGVVRIDVVGQWLGALGELLDDAQRAGSIRGDVTVRDLAALVTMTLCTVHAGDPDGLDRRRYLTLLLDGLRPGAPTLPPPAYPGFAAEPGR